MRRRRIHPGSRTPNRKQSRTENLTASRSSSTASAAGCIRPGRRKKPRNPMPQDLTLMDCRRKTRADGRAATPSDWRVRANHPKAPSPRMARRRHRRRPTASPVANRSWASVAGPVPTSRRLTRPKATPPRTMPARPRPAKLKLARLKLARVKTSPSQLKRQPSLPERASPRRPNLKPPNLKPQRSTRPRKAAASRNRCGPIRFRR